MKELEFFVKHRVYHGVWFNTRNSPRPRTSSSRCRILFMPPDSKTNVL